MHTDEKWIIVISLVAAAAAAGDTVARQPIKYFYDRHHLAFFLDTATVEFVRPGLTIAVQSEAIASGGTITVTYTAQPMGHASPALRRSRVGLCNVLLDPRSSLPNLRQRFPALVRLVHRYYTEVGLLHGVLIRRSAIGLSGRPVTASGAMEVSRFSCMKFLSVRGVCDYAGPGSDSRYRRCRCCLPQPQLSRRTRIKFSRSSIPGPPMPLFTLHVPSRDSPRKTRGQDGFAVLLSCRALSSPASCLLFRKHSAAEDVRS
jgi:hypothetical protein